MPSRRGTALTELLAEQLETLVHGTVGDQEQVGVAATRLVRGPRPVRDREDVVLRPLERRVADRRAALAFDDQTDGVVRRPFPPAREARGEGHREAAARGQGADARQWIYLAHGQRVVGAG